MATTVVSTMPPLPDQQPNITFSTPALPVSTFSTARRSSHPISAMLNPEPDVPSYQRRISFSDVSPEANSPRDSTPDSPIDSNSAMSMADPSPSPATENHSSPAPPVNPPKAKRKRITPEQLSDLVALFEQTDTPSFEVREKLAKKLGMTNREIQVWFQNRRAKANRAKANEHNAAHSHHHRFMHHHAGSVAHAAGAGGAPSHYGSGATNANTGQFHFIPMFGPNAAQPVGFASKRADRRRSSAFQPMVTGIPQQQPNILPSTAAPNKFMVPPRLKIPPSYNSQHHSAPRSAPPLTFHNSTPSTSASSPVRSSAPPLSPASSTMPPQSSSAYTFPSQHHPPYQPYRPYGPQQPPPPLYSPTRDFFNMSLNSKSSPPASPAYPSQQLPSLSPVHGHHTSTHQPLPSLSSQPFFNSAPPPQHRPPPPLVTPSAVTEPKSAIDILATAAEFVQTQERNERNERKENETRRRASVMSYPVHSYLPSQTTLPPLVSSTSTKRLHEVGHDSERSQRRKSLGDALLGGNRVEEGEKRGEWRPWK